MPSTVQFIVSAREPNWQYANVDLAPGETATITATGTWGIIDPPNRGYTGPGGNGIGAGANYHKPGGSEGRCSSNRATEPHSSSPPTQ